MITGTLDKYRLLEMRGGGGGSTGATWVALDTWLNQKVIVKIPHNQKQDFSPILNDHGWVQKLSHHNIVKALTADRAENLVFFVYELVDGAPLRDVMDRHALGADAAPHVLREMLTALAHTHGQGIAHLRLTPSNLFIDSGGRVKIGDFVTSLVPGMAAAGGATAYTSREHLMGQGGAASDLYAAGAVFYELLTGKPPIEAANSGELIQKIFAGQLPHPRASNPSVSPAAEELILRALSPDPAGRFANAAEMLGAVARLPGMSSGIRVAMPSMAPVPHAPTGTAPAAPSAPKAPTLRDKLKDGLRFRAAAEFGQVGREPGKLLSPAAIAVGPDGQIHIADPLMHAVSSFDREGAFKHRFGSNHHGQAPPGIIEFDTPGGIAADSDGNLFVVEKRNCRVQAFTSRFAVISKFGRPMSSAERQVEIGLGGMSEPSDVAAGPDRHVFVTDTGNHRVRVYTREGDVVNKFGGKGARSGEFNGPDGVCVDSRGRICVVDAGNFRLQLFEPGGRFLKMAGRYGVGPGELFAPTRVTSDAEGNFYLADYNRIQVFDPNLEFLTEVKNDQTARLDKYTAIAVDGEGRVFATDVEHCLIIRFELAQR